MVVCACYCCAMLLPQTSTSTATHMQLGMGSACGNMCSYTSTIRHTYLQCRMCSVRGRTLNILVGALNAVVYICLLMVGYFCLECAEHITPL